MTLYKYINVSTYKLGKMQLITWTESNIDFSHRLPSFRGKTQYKNRLVVILGLELLGHSSALASVFFLDHRTVSKDNIFKTN